MSKHTRGPWKVYESEYTRRSGSTSIERSIGTIYNHPQLKAPVPVVTLAYSIGPDGEQQTTLHIRPEDARLIAAAPEMYDAIRTFCDRVERGEIRSVKTYATMKAILNKIDTEVPCTDK